jgi:hypothetical protein
LRIIVLGYIVRGPMGGMAWHHLQYVIGLKALGHDVYFLEDSDDTPWCCYDPVRGVIDDNPAYGLKFAAEIFEKFNLGDRWAFFDANHNVWFGLFAQRIKEFCADADVLLNLSGANPLRPWTAEIPVRVLIETDPVFSQIKNLTIPEKRKRAAQHNVFFTFGENFGRDGCSIPNDGFSWQPTRQPVVMPAWQVTPAPGSGKFTTIMQWDSYPAREFDGKRYGLKSDSFTPFFALPQKTGQPFELAIGSASAPRDLLRENCWSVRDPLEISKDIWDYQRYIQQSKAEFSVAKHGYVVSRSGWFSERSAAYLASGRPVLVQETGFSEWLPTGAGVLQFNGFDEAITGIEEINKRYDFHCRASREIAAEYFDSRKVLSKLIEQSMNLNRHER